jgi:hypothetical protein
MAIDEFDLNRKSFLGRLPAEYCILTFVYKAANPIRAFS